MNNLLRALAFICLVQVIGCRPDIETIRNTADTVDGTPVVHPDYADVTIPPNIAPMNFMLKDSCTACVAELSSDNGAPIVVWGSRNGFRVNAGSWKRLLSENAGKTLRIVVYAENSSGSWRRFTPIENRIAVEPIDRYCTYRLLNFQYNHWRGMRLCQRDLSTFRELTLVNNETYEKTVSNSEELKCVNCHIPMNNDPGRFIFHLRSKAFGGETVVADGNDITKLTSRLGYASWHPGGTLIAFSVYKVQQYFHAVGKQFIDAYDNNSGIVIYDVNEKSVNRVPQLDKKEVLETWPAWTPDGHYLYFCSAPVPWDDYAKEPPDNFNRTKYSMMRIAYDSTGRWGKADTVLSTNETGRSIAMPRISPDNRFCVFCMQEFGPYPLFQVTSDLYLMDLKTRTYRKLPVNSEYNESWHSWSSNGRWLLFSSRRGGGIFTRFYICHIDSAGNAGKPFVMPQRDPGFYDAFLKCYNVGEFAKAPVRFSERELLDAVRSRETVDVPLPSDAAVEASGKWSAAGSRE